MAKPGRKAAPWQRIHVVGFNLLRHSRIRRAHRLRRRTANADRQACDTTLDSGLWTMVADYPTGSVMRFSAARSMRVSVKYDVTTGVDFAAVVVVVIL
jgi:hypothetical protein